MVRCLVCERQLRKLTAARLKTHDLTLKKYEENFKDDLKVGTCAFENTRNNWKCPQPKPSKENYCTLRDGNP